MGRARLIQQCVEIIGYLDDCGVGVFRQGEGNRHAGHTAVTGDQAPGNFGCVQRNLFNPLQVGIAQGLCVIDKRLDYKVVVNWAIAEHKSQGTFQTLMNRWDREAFLIYALEAQDAEARTARWFEALATPQFSARDYDATGATVAPRSH